MNKIILPEKTMTVKEVAAVLGVSRDSIERTISTLYPQKMQKGITTFLNEKEVTEIKNTLARHHNFRSKAEVKNAITNLDKIETIAKAMGYLQEMVTELTAQNEQLKIENAEAKPKAEYYDILIDRGNSTNLRNTARELGLQEKRFIKQLQLDKFLYRDKHNQLCPYSEYVQKGYFEMKEWQYGEKCGIQTLITVTGKQFFLNKYKKAA